MSKVLVTGANGFIAQHLVLRLIKKGYEVVGTVRTREKGDILKLRFPEKFHYELVGDITGEDLAKAIQKHPEIEGVFHTASPVSFSATDFENEVIIPAVNGTKKVLQTVKNFAPHVKRFIYTSSFAAVSSSEHTKDTVITEDTWNQIDRHDVQDGRTAYRISKTYAEKAVWDFSKTEQPQFEINIVNPVFVLGPQASADDVKDTLNLSAEKVNSLLKLKPGEPVEDFVAAYIDVRDVADAHIYAFEGKTTGFRFLLYESRVSSQLILDIINEKFPQLGLPAGEKGTGKATFGDLPKVDNSATRALLGDFVPLEKAVVDAVDQILAARQTAK